VHPFPRSDSSFAFAMEHIDDVAHADGVCACVCGRSGGRCGSLRPLPLPPDTGLKLEDVTGPNLDWVASKRTLSDSPNGISTQPSGVCLSVSGGKVQRRGSICFAMNYGGRAPPRTSSKYRRAVVCCLCVCGRVCGPSFVKYHRALPYRTTPQGRTSESWN
jgi:hypothetical protein